MSMHKPVNADPREGYIFGTRIISRNVKKAMLECNIWLSHDGKNSSSATGNISSLSIAQRPQKVMDTN